MKHTRLLMHFLVPGFLALLGLFLWSRKEPLSGDVIASHLVGGFLFYAAPHLLWGALVLSLKPTRLVSHLGFAAASGALLIVSAMAFMGPRDPSGLPYEWLVYWPFAGALLLVVVVGWLVAGRPHAGA